MQEILLVHDQQESPVTRKSFLEMSGYQVTLATSGAQCLERLSQSVPALVLMDILIEGANGFDVCRTLRTRFTPAQLPVILGSMIYRSRVYRDEALTAGAQRYVLRPIKLDELVSLVNEVLEEQKSGSKAA